jgi:hypothetical protein
MADEVKESDRIMYSVEEARWNVSGLLHEQERLLVPGTGGLLLRSLGAWFAAVKPQCGLMNIGMLEKALKRWVLIEALV